MYSHGNRGVLRDDELERRLQRPRSQEEMHASYADAYKKVTEMVREQGEQSVWKKLTGG